MVIPKSIRARAERIKPIIKRVPGTRRLVGALRTARIAALRWMYGDRYHEVLFTKIWRDNLWGGADSRSGTGSNLKQTTFLREDLANLLRDLSVRHLLDIPCGDFHWMREVCLPPSLVYVGGDIVEEIINTNNNNYATKTISFRKLDIKKDALPKVDLVLCRDCLVHFSSADIFRAIRNLKRSGSTYLLATHFPGDRQNSEIITGQFRPLNLTRPPFNFPPPLRLIDERCTEGEGQFRDKGLALWRFGDLPCTKILEE